MAYKDRYNTPIGYDSGYLQALTDIKYVMYGKNSIIEPNTDNTFTIRSSQDILKDIAEFIKKREGELDEKL